MYIEHQLMRLYSTLLSVSNKNTVHISIKTRTEDERRIYFRFTTVLGANAKCHLVWLCFFFFFFLMIFVMINYSMIPGEMLLISLFKTYLKCLIYFSATKHLKIKLKQHIYCLLNLWCIWLIKSTLFFSPFQLDENSVKLRSNFPVLDFSLDCV